MPEQPAPSTMDNHHLRWDEHQSVGFRERVFTTAGSLARRIGRFRPGLVPSPPN